MNKLESGQQVKVVYRGSQELSGTLVDTIQDKFVVIRLDKGIMTLDKADVDVEPVDKPVVTKEVKKRVKRAYKKANDTDVDAVAVQESEE